MLKAKNLIKRYDSVPALNDISFEIQRGEIFGLLGPNGAGKTTSIRILLGLISHDAGSITLDDKPLHLYPRDLFGYLPEERGLYKKSKVINVLHFFGKLKNMQSDHMHRELHWWVKRFDLEEDIHKRIEQLSKGNQQKVQFIISVMHDPEILILDEPFSGFDPVLQQTVQEIILELKAKNKMIILCTHMLDKAENLCDSLLLIDKGKKLLSGRLNELNQDGKKLHDLFIEAVSGGKVQ